MRIRPLVRGLATFVPGFDAYYRWRSEFGVRSADSGGAASAEYCYSVWLRHLSLAVSHGQATRVPNVVLELGPCDSLGVGLAALLSGASRYVAVDIVRHTNAERNLRILDELIDLFRLRAPIPGPDRVSKIKPALDSYEFPGHLLTEEHLSASLAPSRLGAIRESIRNMDSHESMISYRVPWSDSSIVEPGSIDFLMSQAVLEHVDDLEAAYSAVSMWVSARGLVSHQIDFKSHNTATTWNGHWAYGDLVWAMIRGRRPYLINRLPCSVHRELLARSGLEVIFEQAVRSSDGLDRSRLSKRFRSMSEDDFRTSGVYFLAKKSTSSI